MDYKYIEQLLERYWAAETSLEEEDILRAFFSQKEIPAELEQYRTLFVYEATEKEHYSVHNENLIDIVLFVNGIPVVSMELKCQFTGQDTANAIQQYKFDRATKDTI